MRSEMQLYKRAISRELTPDGRGYQDNKSGGKPTFLTMS
jgi:hypothetical protein